ncbi:MAG: serine hydrolase [Saprospiraceae bacterium]|nr:serine hydrolase [Saprospiraceae bacterium]
MLKYLSCLLVILLPFSMKSQDSSKSVEGFVSELNSKIPSLLEDFNVPGTAVAIINDGEIILQKAYGYADVENQIKADVTTGFNIGSISKTVAAWGIMKLVQEGEIELDAPAEKYLTRWHLPNSEFDSDKVTIRRLLSHTAGLSLHGYPGWSPEDTLPTIEESLNGKNNGPGRVEIIHEPGSRYKYSGGGYSIMQLIIEEVTGRKFADYMQSEILSPLGMTKSSYNISEEIMAASSMEYDNYGGLIDFELFTAQAAAGFHTTIQDFTQFVLANLYNSKNFKKYNTVLSSETIHDMMQPVPQAEGRFGYGLGYMTESLDRGAIKLAGHRGANTGWHAIFNVNPKTNDGFIMLTNGGLGQNVYHAVFYEWALWRMDLQLEDWYVAKPSVADALKKRIDSHGIEQAASLYTDLIVKAPNKYNTDENQLNTLGYHYMNEGNLDYAIKVFKINVDAFPDAYNTYDSYGEALLASGDTLAGVENYIKSIKLNPGNTNGISILNKLDVETDDLFYNISSDKLRLFEGQYISPENPEWIMYFDLNNGVMTGTDNGYRFKILPTGENKFVNADNGTTLVFQLNEDGPNTMILGSQYEFKKLN